MPARHKLEGTNPNPAHRSVATEVVLLISCMAMARMLLVFGRESLEMLPELSYQ